MFKVKLVTAAPGPLACSSQYTLVCTKIIPLILRTLKVSHHLPWHVRFTEVALKALSDQIWRRYLISYNLNIFFSTGLHSKVTCSLRMSVSETMKEIVRFKHFLRNYNIFHTVDQIKGSRLSLWIGRNPLERESHWKYVTFYPKRLGGLNLCIEKGFGE